MDDIEEFIRRSKIVVYLSFNFVQVVHAQFILSVACGWSSSFVTDNCVESQYLKWHPGRDSRFVKQFGKAAPSGFEYVAANSVLEIYSSASAATRLTGVPPFNG
jgi:hypothetical protein